MLPSVFDNALPRLPIPSRSLTEQLHGTVEMPVSRGTTEHRQRSLGRWRSRGVFDPGAGASRAGLGDTLAEFIVREIRDTFDPNATRSQQLEDAGRVLVNAIDDLENVIERLR